MIDLKIFLIISTTEFNRLIESLSLNLNTNDSIYMLTYLFSNFMVYFLILTFIFLIRLVLSKLFKPFEKGLI